MTTLSHPIMPSLHVALSEQKQPCWKGQGRAVGQRGMGLTTAGGLQRPCAAPPYPCLHPPTHTLHLPLERCILVHPRLRLEIVFG